jgi:hypothetical protein
MSRSPDAFRLMHGPFEAPACPLGDVLTCLLRGKVRVDGFTSAPIP